MTLALAATAVVAQTPSEFTPSSNTNLGVSFNSTNVVPGVLLPVTSTRSQPTISFNTTTSGPYLLLMVDPDARTNGTFVTILHWLQQDLAPSASNGTTKSLTSTATGYATYRPPAPPAELPARPHRYIQLLFNQPSNFSIPTAFQQAVAMRRGFDYAAFVQQAGLGEVLAANYFLVQNTSVALETSGVEGVRASGTGVAVVVGLFAVAFAVFGM